MSLFENHNFAVMAIAATVRSYNSGTRVLWYNFLLAGSLVGSCWAGAELN